MNLADRSNGLSSTTERAGACAKTGAAGCSWLQGSTGLRPYVDHAFFGLFDGRAAR